MNKAIMFITGYDLVVMNKAIMFIMGYDLVVCTMLIRVFHAR